MATQNGRVIAWGEPNIAKHMDGKPGDVYIEITQRQIEYLAAEVTLPKTFILKFQGLRKGAKGDLKTLERKIDLPAEKMNRFQLLAILTKELKDYDLSCSDYFYSLKWDVDADTPTCTFAGLS